MALGRSGDTKAAREQLTIAANGSDAEVRAQALEVLQKLGPKAIFYPDNIDAGIYIRVYLTYDLHGFPGTSQNSPRPCAGSCCLR
jgi:hypothetical protein